MGLSLPGLVFGGLGSIAEWMHQEEMQDDSQSFNSAEAAANRAWQERMYRDRYQIQMEDMRRAGLNPMLAAGASPPGAPGGSAASSGIGGGAGGAATMMNSALVAAQVEKTEAEVDKTVAEADEIRARTPRHSWDIAHIGQQISESVQRVATLREQAGLHWASAQQALASAEKLRAELPLIQATIAQLKGLTALQLVQQGLEKARADEIMQRIKANLPQAERALLDLQAVAKGMELPGKQADEAARGSFAGYLGSYLRAILPIEGLIGAIPLGRGRGGAPAGAPDPIHRGSGGRPDIHRR